MHLAETHKPSQEKRMREREGKREREKSLEGGEKKRLSVMERKSFITAYGFRGRMKFNTSSLEDIYLNVNTA